MIKTKDQEQTENMIIVNVDHVTEVKIHLCQYCHKSYTFNNQLHRHICKKCIKVHHSTKMRIQPNADHLTMIKTQLNVKIAVIADVLLYIKSIFITNHAEEYDFRKWQYTTIDVQLSQDVSNNSICLDTDCIMTLINWDFLQEQAPTLSIKHMTSLIIVCELKSGTHQC